MNILIEPWYLTDCAERAATQRARGPVSSQTYIIQPGRPVALEPARHCAFVASVEGVVWLTQEGHSLDYILRPGKEMRLSRRGKAVLQAIGGPARVEVTSAA